MAPTERQARHWGQPLRAISANPRMHPSRKSESHREQSISKGSGTVKITDRLLLDLEDDPSQQERRRLSETLPSRHMRGNGYKQELLWHRDRDPVGQIEELTSSFGTRTNMELRKKNEEMRVALRAKECQLQSATERLDLFRWKEKQNRRYQDPSKAHDPNSLRRFAAKNATPARSPAPAPSNQPEYVRRMVEAVRSELGSGTSGESDQQREGARVGRDLDENSRPVQAPDSDPILYCSSKNLQQGCSMDAASHDATITIDPAPQRMHNMETYSEIQMEKSKALNRTASHTESNSSWKIAPEPAAGLNSFGAEYRNHAEDIVPLRPLQLEAQDKVNQVPTEPEDKHEIHVQRMQLDPPGQSSINSWMDSHDPSQRGQKAKNQQSSLQQLSLDFEDVGVPSLPIEKRQDSFTAHKRIGSDIGIQADIFPEPPRCHSIDVEVQVGPLDHRGMYVDIPLYARHVELEHKAQIKHLEAELMMAKATVLEMQSHVSDLQITGKQQRDADERAIRELRNALVQHEDNANNNEKTIRELRSVLAQHEETADRNALVIRDLRTAIAQHEENANRRDMTIRDLRSAIIQHEDNANRNDRTIRGLESAIARHEENTSMGDVTVNESRCSLAHHQQQVNSLQEECKSLKEAHSKALHDLKIMDETQVQYFKREYMRVAELEKDLRTEIMVKDFKIDELEDKLSGLNKKTSSLDEEVKNSQWHAQCQEEERNRLERVVHQLEQKCELKDMKIGKLEDEKEALLVFNREQNNVDSGLSQHKRQTTHEVQQEKAEQEGKEKMELIIEEKNFEIANLTRQLAEEKSKQDSQAASSNFDLTSVGSKELVAEVQGLRKELEHMQAQKAEDDETIQDLKGLQVQKAKDMEEAVRKLEDALRKKQTALDRSESLKDKLLKNHEESPRYFSGLVEEENATLREKIRERDEEMERMRVEYLSRAREYSEAGERITLLELDNAQWEEDLKSSEKGKVKLEEENKEMRGKLEKITLECGCNPLTRVRELQQRLSQERHQCTVLQKTVQQLQQELIQKDGGTTGVEEGENPC